MWWIGMTHMELSNHHTINLYMTEFHPIPKSIPNWMETNPLWTYVQTVDALYLLHHFNTDAIKFYAQMVLFVWTYVLKLWKSQNNDNVIATKHFPPSMLSKIQGIYAAKDCLPQHTQDQICQHRRNSWQKTNNTSKPGYTTVKPSSTMNWQSKQNNSKPTHKIFKDSFTQVNNSIFKTVQTFFILPYYHVVQ